MELKSIGKFAKRIGVITIGIGMNHYEKGAQELIQKRKHKEISKTAIL